MCAGYAEPIDMTSKSMRNVVRHRQETGLLDVKMTSYERSCHSRFNQCRSCTSACALRSPCCPGLFIDITNLMQSLFLTVGVPPRHKQKAATSVKPNAVIARHLRLAMESRGTVIILFMISVQFNPSWRV